MRYCSISKRRSVYYIRYTFGGEKRKLSTGSGNYQLAKAKLLQFESAQARGEELALPTKTPVADVVAAYVRHIRVSHTARSAQTDTYYLRDAFGEICDELKITSRKPTAHRPKQKRKAGQDRRRRAPVIEAEYFERIATAQIAAFMTAQVAARDLAPRTANRYREILMRLFNWAMTEHGIRMPGDRNPVCRVQRYKEPAPEITFLTLADIEQQLLVLEDNLRLQVMVATLIYAGLRREELLWLTPDDLDLSAGTYGMIRVRAKTIDGEHWQPKTKRNRAVPVSSRLRYYLDKWRLKYPAGKWLFPALGGKRWDTENFSRSLRTANDRAKLSWSCGVFRHTFGSMLAQRGISLYHISAMMGNSPEICRRHYAALVPEALCEVVEFTNAKPMAPSFPATGQAATA